MYQVQMLVSTACHELYSAHIVCTLACGMHMTTAVMTEPHLHIHVIAWRQQQPARGHVIQVLVCFGSYSALLDTELCHLWAADALLSYAFGVLIRPPALLSTLKAPAGTPTDWRHWQQPQQRHLLLIIQTHTLELQLPNLLL